MYCLIPSAGAVYSSHTRLFTKDYKLLEQYQTVLIIKGCERQLLIKNAKSYSHRMIKTIYTAKHAIWVRNIRTLVTSRFINLINN